jgi:hypothetical protein
MGGSDDRYNLCLQHAPVVSHPLSHRFSRGKLLGSWYKKTELGKRTAIFACAAYVGTMISGYMQSAMIAGMDGTNGLEAWYLVRSLPSDKC